MFSFILDIFFWIFYKKISLSSYLKLNIHYSSPRISFSDSSILVDTFFSLSSSCQQLSSLSFLCRSSASLCHLVSSASKISCIFIYLSQLALSVTLVKDTIILFLNIVVSWETSLLPLSSHFLYQLSNHHDLLKTSVESYYSCI